ncbi:MAG: hypothetical protein ACJAYG_000188 [Oceanicoccus sp.]
MLTANLYCKPNEAVHEISSLTTFCSAETCLKILNSQSLRWSAPHLLNDPVELNRHSTPDFNAEGLLNGMIKENYKKSKVYQAIKNASRYEVDFVQVGIK